MDSSTQELAAEVQQWRRVGEGAKAEAERLRKALIDAEIELQRASGEAAELRRQLQVAGCLVYINVLCRTGEDCMEKGAEVLFEIYSMPCTAGPCGSPPHLNSPQLAAGCHRYVVFALQLPELPP